MTVTTNKQKERPGASPEHPSNADYDYRPDIGTSGGAVEQEFSFQPVLPDAFNPSLKEKLNPPHTPHSTLAHFQ